MRGPFKSPALEQASLLDRTVRAKITWNLNTVVASQTILSDSPDVVPYIANGTDPSSTSIDTEAGFGNLNQTTAPSTLGLILNCGDAAAYVGTRLLADSIVAGGSGATAGVATPKGGGTGVTPTKKNIALVLAVTGLDADAQTGVLTFYVEVAYKAKKGGN